MTDIPASPGKYSGVFFLLPLIVAAVLFAIYPWWTVDDAYIAFRYADNLVHHGELNWNPGENPVEGYTGIMLPLLAALFIKVGIPVAGGVKIISLLLFGFSYFDLRRILRRTEVSEKAITLSLFFFALSPLIFIHTLGGLETSMFMLAILAGIDSFLEVLLVNKISSHIRLALILLFACLVRPEGIALGIVLIGLLFFFREKNLKHGNKSLLLNLIFLFLLPALTWFLWRWNYYGLFLPNTYYAKTQAGIFSRESAWEFVKFSITWLSVPFFLVLFCPGWIRRKHTTWTASRIFFSLAAILFVLPVLFVYMRAELWMNYSFRMFAPLYPLALMPLAWAADEYIFRNDLLTQVHRKRNFIFVLLLSLQALLWGNQFVKDIHFVSYYKSIVNDEFFPAAEYLKKNLPSDEWIVCFKDAGVIPYVTKLKTVDFGVLNDEELAARVMPMKEKRDHFFMRNPGAFIFTSYEWEKPVYLEESDSIMADPRFDNYQLVSKFNNSSGARYFLFLYFRKDLVN